MNYSSYIAYIFVPLVLIKFLVRNRLAETMDIKNALIEKNAETLADLVIKLLDGLQEKKRLDFIGKYIDAGIVLKTISDETDTDRDDIVQQVSDFCTERLDSVYYVDADYDDYYDAYDEDAYKNSEWAPKFSEYIRLAILSTCSDNCHTAYESFAKIFDCIRHCEQDFELLGTDLPRTFS